MCGGFDGAAISNIYRPHSWIVGFVGKGARVHGSRVATGLLCLLNHGAPVGKGAAVAFLRAGACPAYAQQEAPGHP